MNENSNFPERYWYSKLPSISKRLEYLLSFQAPVVGTVDELTEYYCLVDEVYFNYPNLFATIIKWETGILEFPSLNES
tara:strand:- start:100990 stop:101223 length:234 start_codon:yes stop_codon:yes gene_type:complete